MNAYGRLTIRSKGLPKNAKPESCSELIAVEKVDRQRKVFCIHQTACCTYAASKGWAGYHCAKCSVDEGMDSVDQHRDLDGLTMLVNMIMQPPR